MNDDIIKQIVEYTLEEASISNYYLFRLPPLTVVGNGAVVKTAEHIKEFSPTRVFIVTDEQIVKIGLIKPLLRALEKNKMEYYVYDKVVPDPTDDNVHEGVSALKNSRSNVVIGFGGGSPIDAAKVIAALATNEFDFSNDCKTIKFPNPRLPLIAIPTTAGTGSEVTDISVITDTKNKVKRLIKHPKMIPDIAIIDSDLTINIPPLITASTGIDVLTHAIEAYVARSSSTLARALALRAIRLVRKYLPTAVGYGENKIARHKMAIASNMAGIAFSNAGLGLCHAMAHQIGVKYNISHGLANALLLPHIMEFNLLVRLERFMDIAIAMGEKVESLSGKEAAIKGIRAVENLIAGIGLPTNLKELGVVRADFEFLAKQAIEDITLATNPRKANLSDIIKVYEKAYIGF